jgi:alpha-L-rhamnosidase
MPSVIELRAELRRDSAYVATPTPRLTWTVESDEPGWHQVSAELSDGQTTAQVDGSESLLVDWPFAPLQAAESRTVRVRVRATSGAETDWSEPLAVTGAFLGDQGWVAQPIGHPQPSEPAQPVLLRRDVRLDRPISSARLLWTAFGALKVEINGAAVDDSVLAPGWTSFHDFLVHETTDVTALLTEGENVLGISLAGAFYTEKYGFRGQAKRIYGDQPSALAQLEITYADGSTEIIATDESWHVTDTGPLRASGIYAGETYDSTCRLDGWSRPGFDASDWPLAVSLSKGLTPGARRAEPVRRISELPVQDVIITASGARVLDFGQNLVGWLKITVSGPRGHELTLRHAEVLENGELGVRPLREAAATDVIRLAGDEAEIWEPEFTYHGFRYAQIDNWPGEFDPAAVRAVVVHSDMRRTGWFESSNAELNQLHENVVWGTKGNFFSIPTDCPQRDERLGWTGDIQVFAPTASFLYDCHGFLVSWLQNLAVDQAKAGGLVPVVSPDVLVGTIFSEHPIAAWGDAATVVPWVVYQRLGDLEVLHQQYPSMKAWVDLVLGEADDYGLWAGKMQLGDWLDPTAPPEQPAKAQTDSDIVASAYLALSLRILSDTATLLGLEEDAKRYLAEWERMTEEFRHHYVTRAGRMMNDAATAYALALEFDLVEDLRTRKRLAARLAEVVRRNGYRIGTGFVGTPLLASALASNGQPYAAERLLLETTTPSWLSTVRKGATTIWERWDSMLDDGSINPGEMTSFNHYALGAVADWMHTSVAGLGPDAPGYRTLRIAPRPLRALDWASARHETPYGLAEVGWRREDRTVTVTATVPANTTAVVVLGEQEPFEVAAGSHSWSYEEPARKRVALSLDAHPSAVIDDEPAFRALLEAVRRHDPARAEALEKEGEWPTTGAVRRLLLFTPPELLADADRALRSTNSP